MPVYSMYVCTYVYYAHCMLYIYIAWRIMKKMLRPRSNAPSAVILESWRNCSASAYRQGCQWPQNNPTWCSDFFLKSKVSSVRIFQCSTALDERIQNETFWVRTSTLSLDLVTHQAEMISNDFQLGHWMPMSCPLPLLSIALLLQAKPCSCYCDIQPGNATQIGLEMSDGRL